MAVRTLTLLAIHLVLSMLLPAGARAADWRWPLDAPVATTYRNGADPYAGGQHRGIDIAAPAGARVVAAAGGTVTFAGVAGASGLTVAVRTADGRFDTAYLHLGAASVARGDRVAAGDTLGAVGTTGRRSIAEPHLHFGVRAAGTRHAYIDPLTLLPPTARPRTPAPAPKPVPVALPAQPPTLGPAPTPAPAPASAPAPTLAPTPTLAPAPTLGPTPALPSAANAPARTDLTHLTHPYGGKVGSGPAQGAPRPRAAAAHAATQRTTATAPARGALDLGWLAACAGLVAAAALLAKPRGPAESLRRGSRAVAAADPADPHPPRATAAPARHRPADSIAPWPTTSPRRSTT